LLLDTPRPSIPQNEFLVYDQSQVRLRFLVLVKLVDAASALQPAVPAAILQQLAAMQQQQVFPAMTQQAAMPAVSTSAAGLIPAGMSEDDMIAAAVAASLCGAGAGSAGASRTGTWQQPHVISDAD
jgi:hypothetical protein